MLGVAQHLMLWETAVRLLVAIAAGAVLGWDREVREEPAGLRTHMLVAMGAAGFVLLAVEMRDTLGDGQDKPDADPLRVVQAVAMGVGFLGAGTIFKKDGGVQGLTTAASIWVVAALGAAAGAGYWVLTGTMTALAFLTLTVVRRVEEVLHPKRHNEKPKD
jgi:putative Mg2+ transporter-C (MgtC) family protein